MSYKRKKTKIVATLGPAISTKKMLLELIATGVNVFRINFSHADYKVVENNIKYIREINKEHGYNAAILADLQGPKLRVGVMKDDITVTRGDEIKFETGEKFEGTKERVYMNYDGFPKDTKIGEKILLDDGKLIFEVVSTNKINQVKAKVIQGGALKSKKGVNLPNTNISQPALTEKDKKDALFAISQEVDWIALSFVRNAKDLKELEEIITKNSSYKIPIIAKIEKPEAVRNIDSIITSCDGLMVARGDLGVEIPAQEVPLIQKQLVRRAKQARIPVIIATQMMESMISNRVPTRAEVFDVANAVTSGVDAIMFSAETAIGKYPSDVISEASRICIESEGAYIRPLSVDRVVPKTLPVDQVIALSAVYSAKLTKVVAIAALTETGSTALWMSRVQSNIPIYAMTQNNKTSRRICLYKGVQSIKLDKLEENHAQANMQVISLMRKIGTVKKGDLVIITKGDLLGTSGGTNAMKVVEVGNMIEVND